MAAGYPYQQAPTLGHPGLPLVGPSPFPIRPGPASVTPPPHLFDDEFDGEYGFGSDGTDDTTLDLELGLGLLPVAGPPPQGPMPHAQPTLPHPHPPTLVPLTRVPATDVHALVTVERFAVDTPHNPSVRKVFDKLFKTRADGHPLCARLGITSASSKCADAAAVTRWSFDVDLRTPIFNATTGARRTVRIDYSATVILPKWTQRDRAPVDDQAEIDRVFLNTALHEAGHRSTPEALATAVTRFLDALPARVHVDVAAAASSAAAAVITDFYCHQARHEADHRHDITSRHGTVEGAVFNKTSRDVPGPRDRYDTDVPLLRRLSRAMRALHTST